MDLSNWTPNDEALNTVVDVLRDSIIPDTEIQKRVQEKITMMQKHPDFTNYLLYVLKTANVYEEYIRALSAITLKNNISITFNSLTNDQLNLIRQESLHLLRDSSKDVRAGVTTLIGTLVWKGDVSSWPDLIPYLCTLLDSSDNQLSETALSALFKICEEYLSKRGTEKEESNESMNSLISKFITLVIDDRTNIRRDSVRLLNQAMQDSSGTMKLQFDSKLYLNNLFHIIKEEDTETQKLICQAFCLFVEVQDPVILYCMHNVIEYILHQTGNEDSEIALQACEFWLTVAKLSTCRDILLSYIDRLLPLLVKNMKYSQEELEALKNYIGIDEHLEDKPDDIRPFNMKTGQAAVDESDFDLCNGEGDYEQNDVMGETYVGWTLRKCSAASLDALSLKFGNEMLPILMPLLNEALNSDDFLIKESGILALGAIAEGCMMGLKPYLPNFIDYLLICMNSEHSLVRVITCWTIGRYMVWVMEDHQNGGGYFVSIMSILLKYFVDSNKRVQRAALSAFCIFQEEARMRLMPYVDFILQAFLLCFKKYKFRSYLLLYDAVGVFAQSLGNNLNKPEYIELLMPPLMQKFNSAEDYSDEQFLALVECMANVAAAVEVGFLPYAEVIYGRCLQMINDSVANIQRYLENPNGLEILNKEPLGVAHDMLLGMAVGLKSYFVKFVTNSNLIQNMYYSLQDEMIQVRQPALALYGELVQLCFSHVELTVHDYIPIIIENIDKRFDSTCNNSAWVINKLCTAMQNKIEPYATQILERFIDVMKTANGTRIMNQTVAVALCTLGLVCPDQVSPHLDTFIRPCCQSIRNVGDCDEKYIAFRGLCMMIMQNPGPAMNNFVYICDALASWNEMQPDLKNMIKDILLGIQGQFGDNWMSVYDQFPPLLKMRLHQLYGL